MPNPINKTARISRERRGYLGTLKTQSISSFGEPYHHTTQIKATPLKVEKTKKHNKQRKQNKQRKPRRRKTTTKVSLLTHELSSATSTSLRTQDEITPS